MVVQTSMQVPATQGAGGHVIQDQADSSINQAAPICLSTGAGVGHWPASHHCAVVVHYSKPSMHNKVQGNTGGAGANRPSQQCCVSPVAGVCSSPGKQMSHTHVARPGLAEHLLATCYLATRLMCCVQNPVTPTTAVLATPGAGWGEASPGQMGSTQQRQTRTVCQSLTALATRNCQSYLMQTINCTMLKCQNTAVQPLRTSPHLQVTCACPAAVGAVKKTHATKASHVSPVHPPCSKGSAVHEPRASLPNLLSNPT